MSGPALTYSVQGYEDLLRGIDKFGEAGHDASVAAWVAEAEAIMALSKETYVPVDLGPLRASGTVHTPTVTGGVIHVEMSYGGPSAPYAEAVHENPRAGKTEGLTPDGRKRAHWAQVGQWKYLETPFLAAQGGMLERIGNRIRQRLGIR